MIKKVLHSCFSFYLCKEICINTKDGMAVLSHCLQKPSSLSLGCFFDFIIFFQYSIHFLHQFFKVKDSKLDRILHSQWFFSNMGLWTELPTQPITFSSKLISLSLQNIAQYPQELNLWFTRKYWPCLKSKETFTPKPNYVQTLWKEMHYKPL